MKKLLAVFMAVMMAFSFCAFSVSAEETTAPTTPATPEIEANWAIGSEHTFDEVLNKVKSEISNGVILLFGYGEFKPDVFDTGTDGYWVKITGNAFAGYYALFGNSYIKGARIKLPTIADAPDGYAGHWNVSGATTAAGTTGGSDYAGGGMYTISDKAEQGSYIFFNAEKTEVEQTPTIVKVMSIFAKIIKILFGGDENVIYKAFLDILAEFGVEVIE